MFWRSSDIPNHLPLHEGPFVPGCEDVMTGFGVNGSFMRLWYPTSLEDVKAHVSKWPRWLTGDEYSRGFATVLRIWPSVMKIAHYFLSGDMHIPVVSEADPIEQQTLPRLPVIVMSHGLGACRYFYSALCLQLASYGYLVASVEHRDESCAATYFYSNEEKLAAGKKTWLPFRVVDNGGSHIVVRQRQLQVRAAECSRALDVLLEVNAGRTPSNLLDLENKSGLLKKLRGRLNFDKATLIGHSFGGAAALTAADKEKRFKQLIILDAWMFALKEEQELPQSIASIPKIFINTETFQILSNLEVMRRFVQPDNPCFTIKATTHEHQCDSPLLLGMWLSPGVRKIDPKLGAKINANLVLRYLHQQVGDVKTWDNERYLEEQNGHLVSAISVHESSKL